jgi:L-fuconolactonase
MFGSDWPVCELAATYAEVLNTAKTLSPTEQDAVFTTTARHTYNLG